jgi:hypothetical protein
MASNGCRNSSLSGGEDVARATFPLPIVFPILIASPSDICHFRSLAKKVDDQEYDRDRQRTIAAEGAAHALEPVEEVLGVAGDLTEGQPLAGVAAMRRVLFEPALQTQITIEPHFDHPPQSLSMTDSGCSARIAV